MDEMIEKVETYIEDNIYHSRLWDQADELDKVKAFNQACNMLTSLLKGIFPLREELNEEDIAQQALWIMKLDDTLQRAEMGITSVSVDGVSVQMTQMDRSIAPFLLNKYGVSQVKKRRVGSYAVPPRDTVHFYDGGVL